MPISEFARRSAVEPPEQAASALVPELPEAFRRYCARSAAKVAVELLSADEDGWCRQAHLSVGEVVIDDRDRIRVALWGASHSAANLSRSGRAVLMFTASESVFEIRCNAAPLRLPGDHAHLSGFELAPIGVRNKEAPYARIVSGVTFRLIDEHETRRRWRSLRIALLAAAAYDGG